MAKKKAKYYVRPDGLHEAIRIIDGKRVAFRGKTDAEVERKMLAWRGEQKEKTRFKPIAEAWWNEMEPTWAYNTLRGYKASYARAVDHYGLSYVADITPEDVKTYIDDFSRGGRSRQVVVTLLQIIRQILDYAVLKQYISINPARAVKPPRNLPRGHREALEKSEIEAIKAHRTEPLYLFPFLIYETGCRYGEALGLRWEDVDRANKLIHIQRSVYYMSSAPLLKAPKTERGLRSVPLLDDLDAVFPRKLPKGYIFSEDGGKTPLRKGRAIKLYDAFRDASGVTATCHQIRHGYATALFEAGVEPKIAQQLLGHAQLSTTMDIYTHIRKDALQAAAQKMNAAL